MKDNIYATALALAKEYRQIYSPATLEDFEAFLRREEIKHASPPMTADRDGVVMLRRGDDGHLYFGQVKVILPVKDIANIRRSHAKDNGESFQIHWNDKAPSSHDDSPPDTVSPAHQLRVVGQDLAKAIEAMVTVLEGAA